MKKTILIALTCFASFAFGQNIQSARNGAIGSTVTIKGVATNGAELGAIRYIQDASGALPIYGSNITSILRGDSVTATGVLFDYSGLLEISPTNSFTSHGAAVVMPTPLILPITSVGEIYESQLVRIENVTFVQTGSFATGNATVQITDGTNTIDVRINGSTNIDGTAIPTGAVTITALVGQFNANYQLIPRDLNDIVAYVAPAQEINIKIAGASVLNNTQYAVGSNASTTVTIENSGTGNLNVTGATFSGANASEFTSTLTATTIAGGGTQNFTINYLPTGNGTRTATILIGSNDSDENPYTINLIGAGLDGLATEPVANPTNLTFPTVKAYTLSGSFTASANTENYIVLWNNGSAVTGVPVDGTTYRRGDVIGNAKVAYIGAGTAFVPRGIIANQNYHFAVFAFNGPAGIENYKTTAPLTGSVTSSGSNIGNYYSGINSNSSNFVTSLSALINPHSQTSYTNYRTTMMFQFEVKDTVDGQSFVTCSYTGENKVFMDPFEWSPNGYSREHTYAHSWMPTYPADSPEKPEYSDQHHLYAVNQDKANAIRSNLPLGEIIGNVVYTYLDGRAGNGPNGQLVYEPREKHRGNAARALFYMATAYNGIGGNNWQFPTGQEQDVLISWHYADQPDNYEIARNEYIFNLQGNRNPYIDSVHYVCHVDFKNSLNYLANNCTASVLELELKNAFVVFPVPASDKVFIQVNTTTIEKYEIIDVQGRVVLAENVNQLPLVEINTNSLKKGTYIVQVQTPFGQTNKTLIIE